MMCAPSGEGVAHAREGLAELNRKESHVDASLREVRHAWARLPKITGDGYPDGFLERVAIAYGELARISDTPTLRLARENDLPPSTAHRWIKEARRRGLVGPGSETSSRGEDHPRRKRWWPSSVIPFAAQMTFW
jgi:hypothetical protein